MHYGVHLHNYNHCVTVQVSFFSSFSHLDFIAMFSHHLHESRDEVGHGVVVNWLLEGPEDLEGASGIVTRGAAQSRLQGHVAQLLLQVEVCGEQSGRMQCAATGAHDDSGVLTKDFLT